MRCALIGRGYWGSIVEKYICESEYFELIRTCGSKEYRDNELEQILNDTSIESVFICTPIETHYDLVKLALKAGKHVFCEKPLTKTLESALELEKIAQEQGVCLYTDYIYTVSPSINFVKEHIQDIGNIIYVRANINQFGNFYPKDNVYEVIGVHLISAIIYILQRNRVVNMQIIDVKSLRHDNMGNALDGVIEFRIDDKINGIINCSLVAIKKERKIQFVGNKGIIEFDMLGKNTVTKMIFEDEKYQKVTELRMKFDESNNLQLALEDFYMNISQLSKDNISLSSYISKIIGIINKIPKNRL